ncbi:MAG: NF038122 family metalloprotease [Planctomycetota bacterium]
MTVVFTPPNGNDSPLSATPQGALFTTPESDLPFDIRFNFGPAIRAIPGAVQTMELAAQAWESYIADPVTVFINVDVAALGGGVLGQASAGSQLVDYASLREMLVDDAINEFVVDDDGVASLPDRSDVTENDPPIDDLDDFIVQHLPSVDQLRFNLPPGVNFQFDSSTQTNNDNFDVPVTGGVSATGTALMDVNRATLKALGQLEATNPIYLEPDGFIEMSSEVITLDSGETVTQLDYFRDDGILPEQFDGLSVAIHEIGHILGFVSSADFFGATITPTPIDLFRFPEVIDFFDPEVNPDTEAENRFEQFETFTRELRTTVSAMTDFGRSYWTEPGGNQDYLVEVPMAQITAGQQTSHWREDGPFEIGILGPAFAPGVIEQITAVDLRGMDVIGWDIVSPDIPSIDVSTLYVGPNGDSTDPRANPFDVDQDGQVSARDALLVVNKLASGSVDSDDSERTDTNGDGITSPIDALGIINFLATNVDSDAPLISSSPLLMQTQADDNDGDSPLIDPEVLFEDQL